MIYQAIYDSPLGDISVQSDGENVTALYFVGQRYDGTMEEGSFESLESLPLWKTVKTYLMCYFKGKQPDPGMLPLAPKGTAFQKRVWQKLLAIPYGNVTTYGAIAAEIAKEGSLTGYAGGIERKKWLLERENQPKNRAD